MKEVVTMRAACACVLGLGLAGCWDGPFTVAEGATPADGQDAAPDAHELAQDSVAHLAVPEAGAPEDDAPAGQPEAAVLPPEAAAEASPEANIVDPPSCMGTCTPAATSGAGAFVACHGACGGACYGTCTGPSGSAPQYDGRPCGPGPGWTCDGTCESICVEHVPTACSGTCS